MKRRIANKIVRQSRERYLGWKQSTMNTAARLGTRSWRAHSGTGGTISCGGVKIAEVHTWSFQRDRGRVQDRVVEQ